LSEHRNEIVLGNDTTGEWARNTVFGDLDRLILDIHSMDPKWRNEVRQPKFDEASNTGYALVCSRVRACAQALVKLSFFCRVLRWKRRLNRPCGV
jgi:hypothetical protein